MGKNNTSNSVCILLEHMYKKFEINGTKIKGGCQSVRYEVPHDSKSDLPLVQSLKWRGKFQIYITFKVFDLGSVG